MDIILASASPRRAELLKQIGIDFSVVCADIDEKVDFTPYDAVMYLSEQKAKAVAGKISQPSIIIAADTIVDLDGVCLGKPVDEKHAFKMLKSLSGRKHLVHTGVSVLNTQNMHIITQAVTTEVEFLSLTDKEIISYIESGEPMDKAGAYGIQGRAAGFVKGINGCYSNVVGLPLSKVIDILKQLQVYT